MGCDAKDIDNDGWVDIVYNDLSGQVFGLMKNEGGNSFGDITWPSKLGPMSSNLSGWSIGFIDYNNDGWMDIYSANGDVDNLSESSKQQGTMFATTDGKLLKDVAGVGFMSSSDRRVHFGLGAETQVAQVEIRWPSGIVQRLDHPAIDRIMKLEKPAPEPAPAK